MKLWDISGFPDEASLESDLPEAPAQENAAPADRRTRCGRERRGVVARIREWLFEPAEDIIENDNVPTAAPQLSAQQTQTQQTQTQQTQTQREDMRRRVQDALQAWKDATRFFENVSDPALVEYAVYEMEAARRRYMFLLKQMR